MAVTYNPKYLTYEDYQSLGGELEESEFNSLEFKAETKVNWYTFSRLENDTTFDNKVPLCVYEIIKLLNQYDLALKGLNSDGSVSILRQSNDGVSTDYNNLSPSEFTEKCEDLIKELILQYLQKVRNEAGQLVLYRGVYPNE